MSRVDTETDRRLPEGHALRGKAAVANAKLAYELFQQRFSGPEWDALAAKGAHLQRPLWASTSTKNPAYSSTLYVDELIGPNTVNTMADASVEALHDGEGNQRADAVTEGVDDARARRSPASPTPASTSPTSPTRSSARASTPSPSPTATRSPPSRSAAPRSPADAIHCA